MEDEINIVDYLFDYWKNDDGTIDGEYIDFFGEKIVSKIKYNKRGDDYIDQQWSFKISTLYY